MKSIVIGLMIFTLGACSTVPKGEKNLKQTNNDMTPNSVEGVMALLAGKEVRDEKAVQNVASAASKYTLGSVKNPVRTHLPLGERTYLRRLRCSNGQAPDFIRNGSVDTGPYGTILDEYMLTCENSMPETTTIFMDMYHPGYVETGAIEGFTFQ